MEYNIRTNKNWETLFFHLKYEIDNEEGTISLHSDGKGNWINDGMPVKEFEDCIDIDIPLTPFTNTLPINRLKLHGNDDRQIRVLYLDILARKTKPVLQRYQRLGEYKYKYENVPNDFEAVIEVDESGLVVNYPGLFVRTARK